MATRIPRPGSGSPRRPSQPGATPREEGTVVLERQAERVEPPPRYQVVMLNDDYTPMEFVVDVLEHIFGMDRTTATRVMLEVHTRGKGVCGVYTFEIAETKVAQVKAMAEREEFPLLCTLEVEE